MPSMLGLVRRDADEIRELRPRTALGALVVVCAMLVLIIRLYQLQILRGDEYSAQSVSNFRKSLFVPADRGMIKDRNGRTLVDNRPSYDVFLTPAFCPPQARADARDKSGARDDKTGTRDEVMAKLATYLSMTPEDIDRMKQDYQRSWTSRDKLEKFKPYLVELDIPRDQVDVLEAHRSELSCVDLIPTPHRNYRVGASLGHVIGYMSEVTPEELDDKPDDFRRGQTIGRRGLERRWERELRGTDGHENIAVNARGQHLGKEMDELLIPESERFISATPGNNLVLSLDERLQEAADAAFPGRAGAVLVMEAKTGFILAMLSRPSFDPNKMSGRITRGELQKLNEDTLKPMLNRVMNENYHPGSTFKVVTSLAGLEEGEITPNSLTTATSPSRTAASCCGFTSSFPSRPLLTSGCGWNSRTSLPSGVSILRTICGVHTVPPFAMAAYATACCSGVTLISPCPMAALMACERTEPVEGLMLFESGMMPVISRPRSSPVGWP